MKLFIRTLSLLTRELNIDEDDSIIQLKKKVRNMWNTDIDRTVRLIYKGRILEDSYRRREATIFNKLSDYNIKNGDTIMLLIVRRRNN